MERICAAVKGATTGKPRRRLRFERVVAPAYPSTK